MLPSTDTGQLLAEEIKVPLVVYPAHHGEDGLFVMIVHLNLSDTGTTARYMMNNRIREPDMVRPNGRNDDFHGMASIDRFWEPLGRYCARELRCDTVRHVQVSLEPN